MYTLSYRERKHVFFSTEKDLVLHRNKMAAKEEEPLTFRLDHFAELQEVTTLIESIGSICHDDILLEAVEERFIGSFEFVVFFSYLHVHSFC